MRRIGISFLLLFTLLVVQAGSATMAVRGAPSSSGAVAEGGGQGGSGSARAPSVLVAVHLQSPDFIVRELKYRVFYNKSEVKHIPLIDYDFKAAFTDEVLNALSEDARMEWRAQSEGEAIDVPALWDRKISPPSLQADRLLLVHIYEYGAFLASLAADKFYITVRMKLIDRASGKKLWKKKFNTRIDLEGKVADLQADNQKGLKVGINNALEKLCAKMISEMRRARI